MSLGIISEKNTWKVVGILFLCLIGSSLVGGFFGAMIAQAAVGATGGLFVMLVVTGTLAAHIMRAKFLSLSEQQFRYGCIIYTVIATSFGLLGGPVVGALALTQALTLVWFTWKTWFRAKYRTQVSAIHPQEAQAAPKP